MRPPEAVELDWSTSKRYRVEAMLAAALVGSDSTVQAQLRDARRRWDPDEVMALTDLPDCEAMINSYVGLVEASETLQTDARSAG